MFKLIVVTLAVFAAVLQIFGGSERRPEVAREAAPGLTLATFMGTAEPIDETSLDREPLLSEAEAIAIAVAAGNSARSEREAAPKTYRAQELARTIELKTSVQTDTPTKWVVSASRVNVRQGPGTSNAVIAQVTLGTEAQILDRKNGWAQIQTQDGGTSGWISGKFLEEKTPS
ncbi:SH3 domain-containing protein [Rhodobacteraceae bacterium]|nr:SH3 domain-containing protein [Paracoccaceae bacterium]